MRRRERLLFGSPPAEPVCEIRRDDEQPDRQGERAEERHARALARGWPTAKQGPKVAREDRVVRSTALLLVAAWLIAAWLGSTDVEAQPIRGGSPTPTASSQAQLAALAYYRRYPLWLLSYAQAQAPLVAPPAAGASSTLPPSPTLPAATVATQPAVAYPPAADPTAPETAQSFEQAVTEYFENGGEATAVPNDG